MKHAKVFLLIALLLLLRGNAALADGCNGEYHIGLITQTPLISPTCTSEGMTRFYCDACGNYWMKALPMTAHTYSDELSVIRPSTCTEQGIMGRKCVNCGAYVVETELPLADHTWEEKQPAKAATCTEVGYSVVEQCSVCGLTRGGELIRALGHDLAGSAWVFKQEATCAREGIIARRCNRCNEFAEEQNIGKASYHTDETGTRIDLYTLNPITPATDPTCTKNGAKAVYQCPTCGEMVGGSIIAKLGHDYRAEFAGPSQHADGELRWQCSRCDKAVTHVLPAYDVALALPSGLTAIEEEAFCNSNIQAVILPDTVQSIGSRAFADCGNLLAVYLPDNLSASIAGDAFEGCNHVLFIDGSLGAAIVQTPDPASGAYVRVTAGPFAEGICLYGGPDKYSALRYIIPDKAYGTLIQRDNAWSKISFNGHEGYAMTAYLTFTENTLAAD